VLTFHRCINYGSYWQARCLVEGLRSRGYDAVLLDHDCPRINHVEWRCAFQPTLPKRTPRSDFRHYAGKARKVLAAVSELPLSRRFRLDRPDELEDLDLVLVGSDEVWNMRHPWYGGKALFYGNGVKAKRLASYAASFGNHDASEGLHDWWADQLRAFSAISVRDDNSRTLIRNVLGVEPELVLDPFLQFPPDVKGVRAEHAYVVVYGHSFPDWYAEQVRGWAHKRGYRLISIGYRNAWADEHRIDASPQEFAGLIAGSAAVATNFFHGTVFALLNDKPFACVSSAYRSNKLRDLTRAVGAEAHLARDEDGEARFDELLGRPLEPTIAKRIAALRERSDKYLAHVLA